MKFLSKLKNFNLLAAVVVFWMIVLLVMLVSDFNKEFAEPQEKIGFIILGDIHTSTWNESHYKGINPQIAFVTNSAEVHAKNMTAYFVRKY